VTKIPWFSFGTHESPEIIQECQAAEAAGFDGVLFPEHHGVPGWSANPLLVAYKVGMATTSIAVGTAPILLPLYEPVRLAETAAFIQNELNGRLILGVGGGYMPEDFAHFGIKLNQRGSRQNEGIEILRLAWSGEPFDFHGSRFSVTSKGCLPVPELAPPIWVCSGAEAGVHRAARYGDALVLDGMRTREEIREFISLYKSEVPQYDRTPEVVLTKRIWVGDPALAASLMDSAVDQYSKEVVAGSDAPWLTTSPDSEAAKVQNHRVIAGDEEKVRADLLEWIEDLKPDRVILKLPFISEQPATDVIIDQLRLIGEVLASLRSS
jgi:alkanesulfonate monooxygenase SsuD/methylene tetrahydromethanopterin reductase-like flavin-dependent oxidoreductase (luciferase family)